MNSIIELKNFFDYEISQLNYVKNNINDEYQKAIDLIYNTKGKIVISGLGKSGLIGQKIAATFCSTGTQAVYLNSSEALHGDLGIVSKKDTIIIISNSGSGSELKIMLPVCKKLETKIIAICGNKNSYLGKNCDSFLNIKVEKEGCPLNLAPMSSTTASLVIGDALAAILMKINKFSPENFGLYHPGGALGRKLLLQIDDIMHSGSKLPLLLKNATIDEIILELTNKKMGAVIIVDGKKCLLGIITEGDIRRALLNKEKFFTLKAIDLMQNNPIFINKNLLAIDALDIMENRESQISVLPVVENGIVIGIIRLHDLVGKLN